MSVTLQDEIEDLRNRIRLHDQKYYVEAAPEISDREYDQLMKQLMELETEHPELVTPESPTQRIGDQPLPHLNQFEHLVPMLSIDNAFSIEELVNFGQKIETEFDHHYRKIIVPPAYHTGTW